MIQKPKFNIGDKVYYVANEYEEIRIECPDCCGKRYVTMISGDESVSTIECAGCTHGFIGPKGYLRDHRRIHLVRQGEVSTISKSHDRNGNYCHCVAERGGEIEDDCLFTTAVEAEEHKKKLEAEEVARLEARAKRKFKDNRSWSWHVHYYRRQIRDAQKTIERATERLNYAKSLAKKENE